MRDYYFNLPAIDDLTIDQRAALREPNAIAIEGGAGCGKSLVSMYRHLTLNERKKACQLLTYTRTLAYYFKSCMRSKGNVQAANNVATSMSWGGGNRDEIIVDEAQDVKIDRYREFKNYTSCLSYGADNAQQLYPDEGADAFELRQFLSANRNFRLSRNFRNAKEILRLASRAFPEANISETAISQCRENGFLPDLYITTKFSKFDKENPDRDNKIKEIVSAYISENNHNIAILCPWQNNVKYYHELLEHDFPGHSYYGSDLSRSIDEGMKQLHITTFKSAKGLEFDTVIIPDFHRAFGPFSSTYHIDWNDFYVGLTRARTNLILISCSNISQISQYVNIYYV